jgi:putative transcriptional regulator|nr:MAG TPA: Cro/C1-type HTH DNA-binding domain protein [Caudoviricetes sp.]
MHISYNKLWKLLIDKGMNKQDLGKIANISPASIAKLGKGANVTTDVLLKICEALECNLEDIIETVKNEGDEQNEYSIK